MAMAFREQHGPQRLLQLLSFPASKGACELVVKINWSTDVGDAHFRDVSIVAATSTLVSHPSALPLSLQHQVIEVLCALLCGGNDVDDLLVYRWSAFEKVASGGERC